MLGVAWGQWGSESRMSPSPTIDVQNTTESEAVSMKASRCYRSSTTALRTQNMRVSSF